MRLTKKLIDDFLKHSSLRCNAGTVEQFSRDLKQFMNWAKVGEVEEVTVKMIIDYTAYLRMLPKGRGSRNTNTTNYLSPRTVARKITVIKNFFAFLNKVYDAGIIAEKIDIPKYSKPKMEYLTKAEFDEFIKIVEEKQEDREHQLRSLLLIQLAYHTGMRLAELLSVEVEAILKDTKMQILGKGKQWRTVYYPPEIQEMVKEYLKYRTTNIPLSQWNKGHKRKLKGKGNLLFIRHDDV